MSNICSVPHQPKIRKKKMAVTVSTQPHLLMLGYFIKGCKGLEKLTLNWFLHISEKGLGGNCKSLPESAIVSAFGNFLLVVLVLFSFVHSILFHM
uniref:Uncharacterized protein n=1 Tax=Oryza glumipatula TaxID=40148 RepID=A0A0D9Y8I0_9ORYZ